MNSELRKERNSGDNPFDFLPLKCTPVMSLSSQCVYWSMKNLGQLVGRSILSKRSIQETKASEHAFLFFSSNHRRHTTAVFLMTERWSLMWQGYELQMPSFIQTWAVRSPFLKKHAIYYLLHCH